MKIKKAIIPAAGLGTRFLPATKSLPKEMLPIIDKPTLQIIVEEAVNSGITDILIIIGRNKESIVNHFDRNAELDDHLIKKNDIEGLKIVKELEGLANIYFIRQNTALGLGHAISLGKTFIGNEPFAVLLGDDIVYSQKPVIKQMMECYEKYDSSILGVQKVPQSALNKYGIIDSEEIENGVYKVHSMVEKPEIDKAPSDVAILGRYIITPEIFDILENLNPGVGNEIQLTDGLMNLSKTQPMYAYEFEGTRYDVGSKIGYIKATIDTALSREEFRDETLEYLKEIVKNA